MDNNVPPYNTLLVVDALIKANKDFDLLLLPNQRHGYGDGVGLHDAAALGLLRHLAGGRDAADRLVMGRRGAAGRRRRRARRQGRQGGNRLKSAQGPGRWALRRFSHCNNHDVTRSS